MSTDGSSREFFDAISADYTAAIDRCVPRYREMISAILHYLPSSWQPTAILELGCGSGNLSELLCRSFPHATIQLVDFSGRLIEQCRHRLSEHGAVAVEYLEMDFRDLAFEPDSLDLVVSSIALHHLTQHHEKAELFAKVFGWLSHDGILSYSDQFAGATADLYAKHMADWKVHAQQLGASVEQWNAWMEHQQAHDHHATMIDQIDWLRDAGFATIDCNWRYILWTVIQARKTVV